MFTRSTYKNFADYNHAVLFPTKVEGKKTRKGTQQQQDTNHSNKSTVTQSLEALFSKLSSPSRQSHQRQVYPAVEKPENHYFFRPAPSSSAAQLRRSLPVETRPFVSPVEQTNRIADRLNPAVNAAGYRGVTQTQSTPTVFPNEYSVSPASSVQTFSIPVQYHQSVTELEQPSTAREGAANNNSVKGKTFISTEFRK